MRLVAATIDALALQHTEEDLAGRIAGWLKCTYAQDGNNQVSHETIYKSLFIQARGALKKELLQQLRSKRTIRRSRHASHKGNGKG